MTFFLLANVGHAVLNRHFVIPKKFKNENLNLTAFLDVFRSECVNDFNTKYAGT